jgi:hypothetical protein
MEEISEYKWTQCNRMLWYNIIAEHYVFKCWNICCSAFIEYDQIFGWVWKFCIMTLHLPQLLQSSRKPIPVMIHPLYSPDLVPCNFLLFPKQSLLLRVSFWIAWRHTEQCNVTIKRTLRAWFPAMFLVTAEVLEAVYKGRRQVLSRSGYCQTLHCMLNHTIHLLLLVDSNWKGCSGQDL